MSQTIDRTAFANVPKLNIPTPPEAEPLLVSDAHLGEDERAWMPLSDFASDRPLMFDLGAGTWAEILRVRGGGVVNRHFHPTPLLGYTLSGNWSYLEHDWVAGPGTLIYEPPGSSHTFVVHAEGGEMRAIFHVLGPLFFLDEHGNGVGHMDAITLFGLYKKHCIDAGLGEEFAHKLVR